MPRGRIDYIKPIVVHAGFPARLDQRQVGLGAAARATEGLGAIVDVAQVAHLKGRVAAADIAAQPHSPEPLVSARKV